MSFTFNTKLMLRISSAAVSLLSVSASSEFNGIKAINSIRDNAPACNISTAWDLTTQAYLDADTDDKFLSFWSNYTQSNTTRLDNIFGSSFLSESNFQCGINESATCHVPDCRGIEQNGADPWVYLAANSISNLNTMFNVMYSGLYLDDNDAQVVINTLAKNLFAWNASSTYQEEAAAWWTTPIAAVAMYGTSTTNGPALNTSFPAFAQSAARQVFDWVLLSSLMHINEKGNKALRTTLQMYNSATRYALELWVDLAFRGYYDDSKNSIFTYMANGRFVNPSSIPDNATVAKLFQTLLVAKLANTLWRGQPVYLLSTTANETVLDPSIAKYAYTSPITGRLYVPYFYKGQQVEVPGSKLFSNSGSGYYNIHMSQVVASSARAWEIAGTNNINDSMALNTFTTTNTFSSSPSSDIWTDQASFPGIFTLPVCDVGTRSEWIVPYGQDTLLPCCCGPYCADSKSFVATTGLTKHYDWRTTCLKQFLGTGLVVDWGIPAKSWFNAMSVGDRAWIVISFIACSFILAGLMLMMVRPILDILSECGTALKPWGMQIGQWAAQIGRWGALFAERFGKIRRKVNGDDKRERDQEVAVALSMIEVRRDGPAIVV